MKRRFSASGNERDHRTPSQQSRRPTVRRRLLAVPVRGNARRARPCYARLGAADRYIGPASWHAHGAITKGSRMHTYLARHSTSRGILPRALQMALAIGLLSCLIVSGPNAVVSTAGAAPASPRAPANDAHKTVSPPHAYLMRGLMNVFRLEWISWRC
jgi:hypothetical protein